MMYLRRDLIENLLNGFLSVVGNDKNEDASTPQMEGVGRKVSLSEEPFGPILKA